MLRLANIRTVLARGFLAFVLGGSIATYLWAAHTGRSLEGAVMAAAIVALLLGLVLERLMPWRAAWHPTRADLPTDLLSMAAVMGIVDPALKLGTALLVAWLYGGVAPAPGLFNELPFLLQVIGAGLLMEFGAYWMHRWHHAHPCLWSLHALHHGPEKLHGLNNFRVHPLNYALQFALSTLPLMLLGVPQDVLLAWLAVSQPVLMLQHLNADLKSGWLNAVYSTNELHRWHHSNSPETGNVNFGSALIVWDRVFGTYRPVDAGGDPAGVGLFATSRDYPAKASYWSQLGVLCGKRCCAR